MSDVVATFGGREQGECGRDERSDVIEGAWSCGAEKRFQFGKRLFDGIEIGTVRRQKAQRCEIGTESNGAFRNITISNIVFDNSRGLALETVDRSQLEDITISNITMRHVSTSPIFMRLGARMRGPAGVAAGSFRRVTVSNVVAWDVDPRYAANITGIPGHDIEDVRLSNIRLYYRGA